MQPTKANLYDQSLDPTGCNQELPEEVMSAICRADSDKIKDFLAECLNSSSIEYEPIDFLHAAVKCGKTIVMKQLLTYPEIKEKLEDINENGDTLLLQAVQSSQKDDVCLLLEAGSCINAQNVLTKDTALHLAIRKNRRFMVDLLCEKKADLQVNLQNDKGNTCLHEAIQSGLLDYVQVVYSCGGKLDIKNKDGHTPRGLKSVHKIDKFLREVNKKEKAEKEKAEKEKAEKKKVNKRRNSENDMNRNMKRRRNNQEVDQPSPNPSQVHREESIPSLSAANEFKLGLDAFQAIANTSSTTTTELSSYLTLLANTATESVGPFQPYPDNMASIHGIPPSSVSGYIPVTDSASAPCSHCQNLASLLPVIRLLTPSNHEEMQAVIFVLNQLRGGNLTFKELCSRLQGNGGQQ